MTPKSTTTPRVSIIMRTRNRPDLLHRAIEDVFAQTFGDWELIVVDDADDHLAVDGVVDELPSDRRKQVVVVSRADQPHGRWLAANAGLNVAKGEFVSLHDDDDFWDPAFLATTTTFLDAHPDAGAACTRTQIVIERPSPDGLLLKTDEYPFLPDLSCITLTDMMRANRIPPISLLYRRALHDELGPYDDTLSVLGDWDFYLRVIAAHPIELIDGPPMAYWSHRPEAEGDDVNSISTQMVRFATDDRIRDRYVREGVERDGLQSYMHLAHEMHWLDRRMDARIQGLRQAEDRLSAQLDRVEQKIAGLHQEVIDLRAHVDERTSLSSFVRRSLPRRRH
jgi:glycosyltransferase involved in cell wall biosynthesis